MSLKVFNEYNNELKSTSFLSHTDLNKFVMKNTAIMCATDPYLVKSINNTINKEHIVYELDDLKIEKDKPTSNILLVKKSTLEAAREYKDKKVAILNFANNHSVGGSPFSAGAQEESLCRNTTLYPCLCFKDEDFYEYHRTLHREGRLTAWGNDDLIYSPGVTVFKDGSDKPEILDRDEWFNVDVITSAAPEFQALYGLRSEDWIKNGGLQRLRKVFEVAKKEEVEVLVLGAWGCGAFGNPTKEVAKAFKILCHEYHFDNIVFAFLCRNGNVENYNIFKEVFDDDSIDFTY